MTPNPNQNLFTFENLSNKRSTCISGKPIKVCGIWKSVCSWDGEAISTWTALLSWILILRIAEGPVRLFLSLVFKLLFLFFSSFFFLMGMCIFFTSASVSNLISCLPPGPDGSSSQRLSVSLTTRTTLPLVASSTRCALAITWIFSSPL